MIRSQFFLALLMFFRSFSQLLSSAKKLRGSFQSGVLIHEIHVLTLHTYIYIYISISTMKVVDINMSNACATLSRVPKRFTREDRR